MHISHLGSAQVELRSGRAHVNLGSAQVMSASAHLNLGSAQFMPARAHLTLGSAQVMSARAHLHPWLNSSHLRSSHFNYRSRPKPLTSLPKTQYWPAPMRVTALRLTVLRLVVRLDAASPSGGPMRRIESYQVLITWPLRPVAVSTATPLVQPAAPFAATSAMRPCSLTPTAHHRGSL